MRIPFTAFAPDCTVSAELSLESDRLADLLASSETIDVEGASLRALDDGRVVDAGAATLLLDDLCLVTATGPRGRPDRRVWTRQLPARARVGPYEVHGYIHSAPTIDPFKAAERRAIVALTASTVEYVRDGESVVEQFEAVLLTGRKIDLLQPRTTFDMGGATMPPPALTVAPGTKDLTTDVLN
ncbi:MAG TPA: hypothetical protein VF484_03625 [Candidatus Limnocylindrales bacterium]